jgi:tape measure domain-containing protein
MSTEVIDIVVRESGAQVAAANIEKMGAAAAVSDKDMALLLQRAGTTSSAMGPLISTTGTAIRSLADLGIGASRTGSSLQAAGVQAGGAAVQIGEVAESATASGAALKVMQAATAGVGAAVAGVGAEAQITGTRLAGMATEAGVADRAMIAAGAAARVAKAELTTVGAAANTAGSQFGLLQASLAGLGLAFGIKQLVNLSDTYQGMVNKLALVSETTAEFEAKQKAVYDIAQASRQPLEAITGIYTGLAKGARNYEVSAKEVVQITETIAKSATIAGKDVEDASGAIKRFGLALMKGTVDGRGFTQFLLQFPGLVTKVAAAIGPQFAGPRGMGAFIKAAEAGEVSAQAFLRGLVAVGNNINTTFARVPITVAGAFTQLNNAVTDFVGRTDQGVGASHRLASAIQALVPYVPQIIQATLVLTAAFVAYTIATVAAGVATATFVTSFAGIAAIITGIIAVLYLFGDSVKVTSDGSITVLGALVGAFRAVRDMAKEVWEWMTTTTEGVTALGVAVTILTGLLWRLVGVAVVGFIRAAIASFIAFAIPIGIVTLAVIGLIVVLGALRFAFVALTKGMDAAKADLVQMKDKIFAVGDAIKSKFSDEMKKATGELSGGLGALKPQIQGVGDEFKNTGISIVRAGQGGSAAVKQLTGDTAESINIIRGGFGQLGGAIKALGPEVMQTAAETKSGMTGVDQALNTTKGVVDQFKNATVADFGQVTTSAETMLNSIVNAATRANTAMSSIGSSINSISRASASGGGLSAGAGLGNYSIAAGGSSGPSIDTGNLGGVRVAPSAGFPTNSGSYGGSNSSTPTDLAFATGGSFVVGGAGGTDSQMVKFLATPGERVTVETPDQAKSKRGGGGNAPIIVKMTVNATDANSFRQSETQITNALANRLRRVQAQQGG